ncbi:MAG: hypothetical protein M3R14_13625 [Acidobacteriota bacterium]|nr:hypothetical protein [Acidobacteriota bacterium]
MALESDKTPELVKDCIKTIIIEASTNADMALTDFTLVRAALPNIIEKLGEDYGRGFLHALHAVIQYDTDAFKDFYEQRLDEESKDETEDLANQISAVLNNPNLPPQVRGDMMHGLNEVFNNLSREHKEMLPDDDDTSSEYINKLFEFWKTENGKKDEQQASDSSLEDLAKQLSAMMKNPLLPTNLYNVMTDELMENPFDTDAPEWILSNLKTQLENEREAKNEN